jgi:zinc and cadmium transporter
MLTAMKPTFLFVLLISLAGDILVFAASSVFLTHKKLVKGLMRYAPPFAAGALLAAAFLDFLHDGVEHYEPYTVLLAALVGLIFFFVLEGVLHWFHHHSKEPFEEQHEHGKAEPVVALAAAGNWLHNFIDGAAIAAAFLVSTSTGIITTIAVALHEIPREIADSGYFLSRGMKRRGVIGVHGIAIIFTAVGTALFFFTGRSSTTALAWLLGSTAGFFIYIGASDIMPSIKQSRKDQTLFDEQILMVILGAVIVGTVITVAHHFIG